MLTSCESQPDCILSILCRLRARQRDMLLQVGK